MLQCRMLGIVNVAKDGLANLGIFRRQPQKNQAPCSRGRMQLGGIHAK
jgi:hypothetical protein